MISTHVLDTARGVPATGLKVRLLFLRNNAWTELAAGQTDADGRFAFGCEKTAGAYQIVFEAGAYLALFSGESFFGDIPVMFKVERTDRKFHVPLLLSPFSYSTYRGS